MNMYDNLYGSLWKFIHIHGYLCICLVIYGSLWKFMNIYVIYIYIYGYL